MKLRFAPIVGVVVLVHPACDAPASAPAPNVVVAALDGDIETDFAAVGAIRVGSCDPDQPTLRAISSTTSVGPRLTFKDVDLASSPSTLLLTRDDTDTPTLNDARYRVVLQRKKDVAGTLTPVSYQSWNQARGSAVVEVHYCAVGTTPSACSSSIRGLRRTLPDFVAPDAGDWTSDYVAEQLTSVTVRFTTTAVGDDIASVNVSTNNGLIGASQRTATFASSVVLTTGTAATVNGVLKTPLGGGLQQVEAELLVPSGASTAVSATVQLTDGITLRLPSQTLDLTTGDLCTRTVAFDVVRPPQTIAGRFFFRPDTGYAAGPRAKSFSMDWDIVNPVSDAYTDVVGWTAGGSQITYPTDGTGIETRDWNGVPVARYRLSNRSTTQTNGRGRREYGHAGLAWNDGRLDPSLAANGFADDLSPFPPLFRFPRLTHGGDEMAPVDLGDATTTGFDRDGHFFVSANETETLDRIADMAYLRGAINLVGCADNGDIVAGTAEVYGRAAGSGGTFLDETGATRSAHTGTEAGFARGLFEAGGAYEIAASAGPWVQHKYRLALARPAEGGNPALHGTLTIRPEQSRRYDVALTPGIDNVVTAPTDTYATSRISFVMRVKDPNGVPQPFYRPKLSIGVNDDGLGEPPSADTEVRFPATGDVLGYYSATSTGTDDLGTEQSVQIFGLANSVVNITKSALVPGPDGDQLVAETFPYEFPAACEDVCVVDNVPYYDDGAAPAVTLADATPGATSGANIVLPPGTTTTTVVVTVSDALPVLDVTIGGVAATAIGGGQYQATLTLTPDVATTFEVVARDLCLKTTTLTLPVSFEVPSSCGAEFEMCMEDGVGSVFWVELESPSQQTCLLRCEVASPGAPVVCAQTPVCPE